MAYVSIALSVKISLANFKYGLWRRKQYGIHGVLLHYNCGTRVKKRRQTSLVTVAAYMIAHGRNWKNHYLRTQLKVLYLLQIPKSPSICALEARIEGRFPGTGV